MLIKVAVHLGRHPGGAQRWSSEGIHCNLTLLFAFCQAVACGDAGVQLISPFVGRIYDWHKKSSRRGLGRSRQRRRQRPRRAVGARRSTTYYKKFGIATEVMGASFRNVGQIQALAGCDLLTISPELLAELQASDAPLPRALDAARPRAARRCHARAPTTKPASASR